ncbi:MAG: glycogen synthase [Anaerolineae bacterium]|nr:glycogen synthase [Anaerolineae bacterium]
MNVLFASAEVAPFAKAGGLGDVVGSLPKALREKGIDARVLMPLYGTINRDRFRIEYRFSFQFSRRRGTAEVYIHKTTYDGVPIYFLESWPFFSGGDYLYTDWEWDTPRYIFFSQAVMALAWQLGQGADGAAFFPDILHAHDWHTGLVPFLLNESRGDPNWSGVGSVLTLHNMAFQGPQAGGFLWDAGVPERHQPDLVYQDKTDNLLGIGIAYADQVNTVSPTHATEIQYPRFGEGLEGLLRVRQPDLYGILNGMDMQRNDPATDPNLQHHYTAVDFLEGKRKNKLDLQREMGLPERADVPLIGIVSRLTDQKGIDLALPALRRLFVEYDVQFIGLGSGESALEDQLHSLCADFAFKARDYIGFVPSLAQRIYAASDLFLMPSRYEPCGTSQMLAMRYGSLPVVRQTGGLADTVQNYDNGDGNVGTGFSFLWEEPDAVLNTLRWGLDTYRFRSAAFQNMQRRAMGLDFSWDNSTDQYIAMYRRSIARHR